VRFDLVTSAWRSCRRLFSWLYLHVYAGDLLDVFANIALVAIAIGSVNKVGDIPKLPKVILYPAIAYVIFTVVRLVLAVSSRKARDHGQRESVCQVFHWLYQQMFENQPDRRFTLFVRDPFEPTCIVPKVRYRHGHRELFARSGARYRAGEGSTGRAWEHTGRVILSRLPPFTNRDQFIEHYVNVLKIRRETVEKLSDYMIGVQSIYSYGFLDHKGDLLGVVSIDVRGEANPLDLDLATKMVGALEPMLQAFS
jgi:hypothetical protein